LILACATTACGVEVDGPESAKVVVLGSSTAFGVGPSDFANTWVERYRTALSVAMPDVEVLNLAFPGFTTYSIQPDDYVAPADRPTALRSANASRAVREGATVIIVNLPSNDQAMDFAREEQEANYDRVVDVASDAGIPVWITTTQPRNFEDPERIAAIQEMRDAITTRYAPRVIDFWSGVADPDGRIPPELDSGDGVHLNDDAHAILADSVLAAGIL